MYTVLVICMYRDLSGNQLNGSISPELLKRTQDGTLNLRYPLPPHQFQFPFYVTQLLNYYLSLIISNSFSVRHGNNPDICTDGNSCQPTKTKNKLAIYGVVLIAVIVVMVLVAVALFCLLRRRNPGEASG